jgi:hypothetical protein
MTSIRKKSIILDVTEDDSPMGFVERVEEFAPVHRIVWYGYDTNWTYSTSSGWEQLISGVFVACAMPKYEKMYLELENKSKGLDENK